MQQKRKRDGDVPMRPSNMEQTESRERMTNRESSGADLGTTSDRAMFDDEAESRLPFDGSGERDPSQSGGPRRGSGSRRERQSER